MNKYKDCSAIILAAGRSSRMGLPKFAMPFDEKKTFLDEIIYQYNSFGCKEIVVVMNSKGLASIQQQSDKFPENVFFVENIHLEWERFYSIKIGVQNLSKKFPVFIHNVDNPFVNKKVLSKLFTFSNLDFIVPVFNGHGGHPVLISQQVCKEILIEKKNDIIFSNFLKRFEKTIVEIDDENILVNINTKEKYSDIFYN